MKEKKVCAHGWMATSLPCPYCRREEIQTLRARNAELEAEKYIPGRWKCVKCACVLYQRTLYVKSGTVGPNDKPCECPNKCGPMWRVTYKEAYAEYAKLFEDQFIRLTALEKFRKEAAEVVKFYADKESYGSDGASQTDGFRCFDIILYDFSNSDTRRCERHAGKRARTLMASEVWNSTKEKEA